MKTTTLFFLFAGFLTCSELYAQHRQVNLNMLAAPATPAAALLGFSPSVVDKPRDASEFLASVVNTTGGLSGLPSDYAVEIAPAWMLTGHKIDSKRFRSNKLNDNFWQGMTISAAVGHSEEVPDSLRPLTQVAFGFKTSILRGHRFSKKTEQRLADAQTALRNLNTKLKAYLDADLEYQQLVDNAIDNPTDTAALNRYREKMYQSFEAEELQQLEENLRDLRFDRVGFKLDLTAGLVQDFPGGRFGNSRVSRAGVWLTTGYEWEQGFSFLGIARYLQNPDADYTDDGGTLRQGRIRTFDAGFRAIFAPIERRFTVSAEGLYRKMTEPDLLPSSWRFTFNAEYKFSPNMCLNFSYGRDFDGVVTRDGNVIALLSLFTGFGNAKPMMEEK